MKFLVKKQQIDCIERDKLADGQIAFVSFRFVFDNEWEGLYKVVQFMQGENTYNISLGVDGYSCKMPSELQAGCAEMSLFGYAPDDETALRATTAAIKLRIEQSGFSSSGSEVVPPTPDLYQQLIAKIDEKIASVHDGADGKDGADGFSPTVTVTETSTGATITATDKNGTTTATVKNGTNAEAALWGDYTPGWDSSAHAMYCTAKLVTVYGKQTWQVLPSISTVSHNALDIVPDGLFVLDLSPDVDTLKASAHTHDNKEFLDGIETYLHSTYSKVTAEREAADNNLATRIKALEDSVGDISTALATMVEV